MTSGLVDVHLFLSRLVILLAEGRKIVTLCKWHSSCWVWNNRSGKFGRPKLRRVVLSDNKRNSLEQGCRGRSLLGAWSGDKSRARGEARPCYGASGPASLRKGVAYQWLHAVKEVVSWCSRGIVHPAVQKHHSALGLLPDKAYPTEPQLTASWPFTLCWA